MTAQQTAPQRALVLVDVQNDYFDESGPLAIQYPPREESLARIIDAIGAAQQAGVPIAVIQHEYPEGAPVFAAGSEGWRVHPQIEAALQGEPHRVTKNFASVFAHTDMLDWVRENGIDTITLTGYMTNNCVLGTAADAEPHGIGIEVLSDATGAIHLANSAGAVSAQQVHETLLVLLNSNFAAVGMTQDWASAVSAGQALPGSDLGTSAVQGRDAATQA